MKAFLTALLTFFLASLCHGIELKTLPHEVIHDDRTYLRETTDRRYSAWTDSPEKAAALLAEFGIQKDVQLAEGSILAIFLNDLITEDLVQIVAHPPSNRTFADYAESGIKFKLGPAPEGKRYTHLTAVIFTPEKASPGHLGMRSMVKDRLSDKK